MGLGLHSIICQPIQTGWYSIYLPQKMEGWVDFGVGYIDLLKLLTCAHTVNKPGSNYIRTRPGVKLTIFFLNRKFNVLIDTPLSRLKFKRRFCVHKVWGESSKFLLFGACKVKPIIIIQWCSMIILRATACNASRVLAIVQMSVRPSHSWSVSKPVSYTHLTLPTILRV